MKYNLFIRKFQMQIVLEQRTGMHILSTFSSVHRTNNIISWNTINKFIQNRQNFILCIF